MGLKKVILCAIAASMLLTGCAAKDGTVSSGEENSQSVQTEEKTGQMERTYEAEEQYVKMLGRTHSENGILWLAHSASGVEFKVKGTKCSVKIIGDSMIAAEDNQARFAAFVDGERVVDEMITQSEVTYDVFSYNEEKEVTVRLMKISEAANSILGIDEITVTSESDIAPTEENELKIEFIGDSITCGYGVDDEDRDHHFSTKTEDATKAYAYKTAELLNADYSLVSYSGHGIISGYTTQGKKVIAQQLPKKYDRFAVSGGNGSDGFSAAAVDWDFTKFVPDIIVINLGTNDCSYTGKDEALIKEYSESYTKFLAKVRKNNADAHIICTLGVMGADLYNAMCEAAENYTAETGDENISTFRLSTQDGSTGFAADWHPTAATHDIAAAELADYINASVL